MVEIREGRTYVARNGDKVGPLRPTTTADGYCPEWKWTVDGDRAWKTDGSYSDVRPVCDLDLIAEWTEGPVRTVTCLEVVEGTYAEVSVGHVIDVPDCENPDAPPARKVAVALYGYRSSTELKAAAAVLLELAGALDSE